MISQVQIQGLGDQYLQDRLYRPNLLLESLTMTLAITDKQKNELNENGFTVLKNILSDSETDHLNKAMDEVADKMREIRGLNRDESITLRNSVVYHEAILDLLDHPRILPLIVDVIGWNIQNRDSLFDYKMPQPGNTDPNILSLGWHFDYESQFAGTTLDGRMPLLDFKVGWYVSDHSEPSHSTILFVPGSFKWTFEQRKDWQHWLKPNDIYELRVPAGSAMLWRPTLLHGVTPNLSKRARKVLYFSYTPRWMRPSGYMEQDSALIKRSSPIRRQLLGAMGDDGNPLGSDPVVHPVSQYWFSEDGDSVPLKAWAETYSDSKSHDWGLGLGSSSTRGEKDAYPDVNIIKR